MPRNEDRAEHPTTRVMRTSDEEGDELLTQPDVAR
jgi:hypothetical protein